MATDDSWLDQYTRESSNSAANTRERAARAKRDKLAREARARAAQSAADKKSNATNNSRVAFNQKNNPGFKAGQKVNQWGGRLGDWQINSNPVERASEVKGLEAWSPLRNILNFTGDLGTGFTRNQRDSYGTGLGDSLFGVEPGYYAQRNRQFSTLGEPSRGYDMPLIATAFNAPQNQNVVGGGKTKPGITDLEGRNRLFRDGGVGGGELSTDQGRLGLADALAQIKSLMEGMGMGGGVSYDPLRSQARSQWADADARTLAMYQQLQGAIKGDAADLNTTYDQGVANTNAATQFANTQNLQSAQGMNAMQSQQAQALGIEEAVANDIAGGNYAAQDAAARTADTTARGQLTSNQMNTNRASALDYNTDLAGSAGLAGAQARMARQNELNRLLAGYDVQEQEANAGAAKDFQNQQFSLAEMLMGMDRQDYDTQNELQRWMTQEANEQQRWEAEFGLKGAGGGKTFYTPKTARAQALKDYGWTEADLDDTRRNLIVKRQMEYQKLGS